MISQIPLAETGPDPNSTYGFPYPSTVAPLRSDSEPSSLRDQISSASWNPQNLISCGDMIWLPVWSLMAWFQRFLKIRPATKSHSHWPGWKQIETLFIFGDSYSSTEFNLGRGQPNPSNPLGNPPYPGTTSSNGPNWVDLVTTTWNESYVETYNFAAGGATVDSDLVEPFLPTVISMKQQIEDQYLPNYGSSSIWEPETALFGIWIGINDVGNSFAAKNETLNSAIFTVYSDLVDKLYVSGARNFLFLNVPPLERTPRTVDEGPESQTAEKTDIADFNSRLNKLVINLTSTYFDATAVRFDAHALFAQVLDDPSGIPETAGYKNVTDWCQQYMNGTPERDTLVAECGVAVNEYLWLNDLHPTYPIHNATAHQIALQLTSS